MTPRALILHATGTNRDYDAFTALKLAGAYPEIVHINQLKTKEKKWSDYSILVIPGGFSYADALGAGKLFALDLINYLFDEVNSFVLSGKPVIGICNGFQVLIKSGILSSGFNNDKPNREGYKNRKATLANNKQGRFECRFTTMIPQQSNCIWTKNLSGNITCPIAHGEGRFLTDSQETLETLIQNKQIALVYANEMGTKPANGLYPFNPNGSVNDIAGICNPKGNVLGLMPHPENNVIIRERDSEEEKKKTELCLDLWKSGVDYIK